MSLTVTGGYGPVSWDHPALEREKWYQFWRREVAAVSEGFCPEHQIPLEPVAAPARRIAGHCQHCRRFWGLNLDTEQVGWWLDHDPWCAELFSCAVPDWMQWRPDG